MSPPPSTFVKGCSDATFAAYTRWLGHGDPFERHRPRRGTPGDSTQLRLGVLYAGGRRAATTGGHWRPPDDDDDGRLVLQQGGGGGSSRGCDWDFWVHPLPPGGPVTLVASWLDYGIAESRAELDGAAIREAAGRAVTLWPEEPDVAATPVAAGLLNLSWLTIMDSRRAHRADLRVLGLR